MTKLYTVFISAENPMYQQVPLRRNNAVMYMLLHDLNKLVPFKNIKLVQFVDIKTGYSEKSFRVVGVTLPEIIQLARYYKQKSIIIDGKGMLDINSMMLSPQRRKYIGEAAYKHGYPSFVEGEHAVSYEIDFEHPRRFTG